MKKNNIIKACSDCKGEKVKGNAGGWYQCHTCRGTGKTLSHCCVICQKELTNKKKGGGNCCDECWLSI